MGVFNWLREVVGKMFKKDVERIFAVDAVYSARMEKEIQRWNRIIGGYPEWIDLEDNVETINFAKFLTSDIAKKICLDIDINVTGSARADYIASVMKSLQRVLRDKVEDACATGGIMFKLNGASGCNCIDYVLPDSFLPTDVDANGNIKGCIFSDYIQRCDKYYTRLEYHRFEGDRYLISNKAYVSNRREVLGKKISLDSVPQWSGILPEVSIEHIDRPLFAYYKMPYNNTIDISSPLGVSCFYNAIKELKDLDIAWSRKSLEIEDSKNVTFVPEAAIKYDELKRKNTLPRFLKGLEIEGDTTIFDRKATLLTDDRIKDINSILAMISTKGGFSPGQFVLDGRSGMMTATQVEADDRETIETIKDMRDALKDALEHLIYIIDKYIDLYSLAPVGIYETSYSFGDLTYNWEEDRARHWQYVQQGKYPLWMYYVKFEGMSEEEAKAVVREAQGEQPEREGIFAGGA